MKRVSVLCLALASLLLGCGGSGHDGSAARSVSVRAASPLVAVGGSVPVELTQEGFDDPEFALEVVEKDGGRLASLESFVGTKNGISRLYAAPLVPGTYHLRGTATEGGRSRSKTVAIQVVLEG